jgi:hypothetical protein
MVSSSSFLQDARANRTIMSRKADLSNLFIIMGEMGYLKQWIIDPTK